VTLRVIRDEGDALDRDALQERGNELATQIRHAAAEAIKRSMVSDVFERGKPLLVPRLHWWKKQAREAIKAWQEVEALISELLLELDKFNAEERRGKTLTVIPDPSGKPGHYTTAWVDAPPTDSTVEAPGAWTERDHARFAELRAEHDIATGHATPPADTTGEQQ
jgi:hypothetical protein